MPLSEHEQRLLDQIERALYQDDPKFATSVRSSDLRTHMRRRLTRAAVVLVAGFVLMFAGVVAQQLFLGVAGFLVMLGALLLALAAWKRLGTPGGSPAGLQVVGGDRPPRRTGRGGRSTKAKATRSGTMMERLEERWKRRWDERGREQ